MNTRYLIVLTLLAVPYVARGEIVRYLGSGELMMPVDGASGSLPIKPGDFIKSPFRQMTVFFQLSEGYETDFISMGTPTPASHSSMVMETVNESAVVSSSDAAAVPDPTTPAILEFNDAVGVYTLDTETGIDFGVECTKPPITITIVGDPGDRIFRIDYSKLMEM